MIAELGVAPLALLDISARAHRLHSRMLWASWLDTIQAHGSVVFASEADLRLMKDLLDGADLTPDEKKRWSEMLVLLKSGNRLRVADPGLTVHLDDVDGAQEIATIRQQLPLVAVFANESFERLYPGSEDGAEAIDDRFSAAVAGSVSSAPVIRELFETASKEMYPADTDREVIWSELFHDLASLTKRITIVDRYLFGTLARRQERRQQFTSPEHLGWFLEKVDRHAPDGTRVQLICQLAQSGSFPRTAADLLGLLRASWSPRATGSLKAVDVIAVLWNPNRHPHNRHIRFGDSWAYTLDEGLDRLSKPTVWDPDGFNFGFKWRRDHVERLRQREKLVQNDAASERVTWTLRP